MQLSGTIPYCFLWNKHLSMPIANCVTVMKKEKLNYLKSCKRERRSFIKKNYSYIILVKILKTLLAHSLALSRSPSTICYITNLNRKYTILKGENKHVFKTLLWIWNIRFRFTTKSWRHVRIFKLVSWLHLIKLLWQNTLRLSKTDFKLKITVWLFKLDVKS